MRLLGVLVLLFAFTVPAYADTSVDWSAYVETNPSRQLTKTSGPSKPVAAAPAKAEKRVAKSKTKGKKVKARAKRPSRRK